MLGSVVIYGGSKTSWFVSSIYSFYSPLAVLSQIYIAYIESYGE